MLTKKLTFDSDVLAALKEMEFSEDGTQGRIVRKLDRGLYTRVDKALKAMGGTWNRSAQATIFPADPRGQVEGLLETGTLTVERDGFFETPERVIEKMLELVPCDPFYEILEPSAGKGAIANYLSLRFGKTRITCVEKNAERARILAEKGFVVHNMDFLQYTDYDFDRIYMNPPFEEGQDMDHVRYAYDLLAETGALVSVMAPHFLFGKDRRSVGFREWLNDVGGLWYHLPPKSFASSGTDVNAVLVVIRK